MEQSYLEFHPEPYILPDILYYNTPLSYFQHSNYMTKKPKAIADKALNPHHMTLYSNTHIHRNYYFGF